ncbi:MAG: ABC transporter substrate-binding protein, partial [Thermoprotei archaeon]
LPSFQDQWLPEDVLAKFTKYEYDPAKAEEILKAAGYYKGDDGYWRTPDGKLIELEVTCPAGYSDWVLALDELVRQLNEFGIKAEARPIPNPTFWPTAHSGKLGLHLNWFCCWWGTGDPYTGYYDLFFGDRSLDTGVGTGADGLGLVNQEFDTPWGKAVPGQLVEQLLVETDPEKRKEIVWKLAYIVNENLWEIPWAEKRLQIYYLDGVRATGWPLPDDPVWTLYPGGGERVAYVLISRGILKPVISGS